MKTTTLLRRITMACLMAAVAIAAEAQGTVKGKVLDKASSTPLEFINVTVARRGETKILKGAITDINGNFTISGLDNGDYTLTASFTGYKEATRQFSITPTNQSKTYGAIHLSEDAKALQEVTVVGQRSEMKLEVDRKSFNVDQQISNAGGSASDVLENIPSVEVDNDGNISLRGNTSVEVWINGKASGLTTDNRSEILQQLPAESIERVEVIDNPSAKFSAEGSAGIINIVLKKDRKAGYYGSLQAGVNTRKGANSSFNINYNSSLIDAYANIGYRHRHSKGGAKSRQTSPLTNEFTNYDTSSDNQGNNLFSRAGVTLHATKHDDISLNGMFMYGGRHDDASTYYYYGDSETGTVNSRQYRNIRSGDRAHMYNGELNYRHSFTDRHYLDFVLSYNNWNSDQYNRYNDIYYTNPTDDTDGAGNNETPDHHTASSYPQEINNRTWEMKLDYENPITEKFKLQAGYNGRFSHENTPQWSYNAVNGSNMEEDKLYFNRFVYDMDVHALYATGTYNNGKFGAMAGLRGEYWKVDTKSYDWDQEHSNGTQQPTPFKKDYFELFPSLFLSYQITPTSQLQLNYTRRLRRPWGGQLNSYKNMRDATVISFGNPELTPEFSNSFSLNYLKTWTQHSLLISAYYRPTTDVMQRITYQSATDGLMYQTHFNVARSTSTGLELTAKNRLFRILDITSSANFYYYKLNGFDFDIDNQTIHGDGNHNFTWNARVQASLMLPYDISFQATGNYRSRQVITQGYRKANYGIDLGLRKNFFNKKFTVALNCRDLLNSRRWKNYTSSEYFTRHQENWRNSRTVRLTLTWNFGNNNSKRRQQRQNQNDEEFDTNTQYNGAEE